MGCSIVTYQKTSTETSLAPSRVVIRAGQHIQASMHDVQGMHNIAWLGSVQGPA